MATNFSEESGSDTDSTSVTEPGPAKKTRLMGAFRYKTSYCEEWKKTWPFVSSVPGNRHSFRCNVCDKNLSCGHQGAADIKDHIATQSHQKLAKLLATQPKLSFPAADPLQDKVNLLNISSLTHNVCT